MPHPPMRAWRTTLHLQIRQRPNLYVAVATLIAEEVKKEIQREVQMIAKRHPLEK